jgi:deoxyribodipyrimidine photo-lyase
MGVDHNGQALDTHIENRLNLVWLKRELRLQDHPPQAEAMQPPGNVLLFYGFEPDPLRDPHDDNRRWRFVWPSLMELNQQLQASGSSVLYAMGMCSNWSSNGKEKWALTRCIAPRRWT